MDRRARGEGTVRLNTERERWEARLTIGTDASGKLRRKMVTGRSRKEVIKKLNALRQAVEQGQAPADDKLTVRAYLTAWMTDVLPSTVSPGTAANYRNVVKLYVLPHIGGKRLSTLKPDDVDAMLSALEAQGLSANTRRLARSVLRRALRRAEQRGLVSKNVAALADGVKMSQRQGRTLTPEQARKLLAHVATHRLGAAFAVALALGLRRGELLGLTWDDLALDATPARLTVHRSLRRLPSGLSLEPTKTAGSRRTLHLPAPLVDALCEHRARQEAERLKAEQAVEWPARPLGADLLFRSEDGTAVDPDNFRNMTYRVTMEALGEKWSPHELRHSAASLLIAQGLPLKVVSELLGHTSIRITADVYGHLLEPAKQDAADAITAVLWS